jgi:two-component system OmpR family sensor kinase
MRALADWLLPIRARCLPIRLRIAAWYAAFLMVAVVGMGAFLLTTLDDTIVEQIDDSLQVRASRAEREIATGADEQLDPTDVRAGLLELAPLDEFSAPGIYVQVRDQEGQIIAASPNLPRGELPITAEMIAAALGGRQAFASVSVGPESVRLLAEPIDVGGRIIGIIVVGQSLRLVETTLDGLRRLVLIAGAGAAVVAVVGGWWLTTRALDPVAAVTRVAADIAATGRFERRISGPPTGDELGKLTATFNEMLARIEQAFRRQQEFLADASHELRGPLMVLRGNLDLLRMGLPEDESRASVREAGEEVERMSRLAADLLFLAEADAREIAGRESVELDEVATEAWERARALDGGAHELALGRADPALVRGDRMRLGELVWNLLENALRYTPAGGRIDVELRVTESRAELTVADTGIGIPPEHAPRVFERFYRVDPARSRSKGGAGLGLAIVKRIAEAHGGEVWARSEVGRGSTFGVSLPLLNASPGVNETTNPRSSPDDAAPRAAVRS